MHDALARRGLSDDHAALVVEALIGTSRRGVHSHGLRLFPVYLRELDGGRARARPTLRWDRSRPAVARLDAGGALGVVAGRLAAAEAVALARRAGVGAVVVADSNHFGAAAVYALAIAEEGLIGVIGSSADALVAPAGGTAPTLGTNPLAVAARGEGETFCLDMATSQISWSQMIARFAAGDPSPGWALDQDGQDVARSGAPPRALLPLGGYKGQGLAMAITLITALLADGPTDGELSHLYAAPWDTPRQVSHLILAIDPGAFVEPDQFRRRLTAFLAGVRGGPARAPGDRAAAASRSADSLQLDAAAWADWQQVDPQSAELLRPR